MVIRCIRKMLRRILRFYLALFACFGQGFAGYTFAEPGALLFHERNLHVRWAVLGLQELALSLFFFAIVLSI
jgi:hypothetical protein